MSLALTEDEFIKFLNSPKFVEGPLRYNKKNKNHNIAQASVRCPEFPDLNIRLLTQHHVTRIPRKFNIILLVNNERVFSIDVNPGRTHTNPNDLKTTRVIRGTHWQIYPHPEIAIADNIDRTHQQWVSEFLRNTNITMAGGYTAPAFEVENVQFSFLGGET